MAKNTKRILSATEIEKASDLKTEEIDVKEWGGTVAIRELSVAKRQEYSDYIATKPKDSDIVVAIIAMSLVGADGSPLFQIEDMKALQNRSPAVLQNICKKIYTLNGLDEASQEKIEKN